MQLDGCTWRWSPCDHVMPDDWQCVTLIPLCDSNSLFLLLSTSSLILGLISCLVSPLTSEYPSNWLIIYGFLWLTSCLINCTSTWFHLYILTLQYSCVDMRQMNRFGLQNGRTCAWKDSNMNVVFFRLLVIKGGGSARYTRETTVRSWPSIVPRILEISGTGILEWKPQWPVVDWGNESVYGHV